MSPTDKLTILFLAANPLDTNSLQLDEEVRAIDKALRESEYRDWFDLQKHFALRYADLPELLLRYNPHIVHFSGHGSPTGELIFSDDAGKKHLIPPELLADLFDVLRDNIRCVVLNACYSDTQAEGIARSIDCVVGMTRAVPDEAARRFASSFYTGLGYGRSVANAFKLGRINMGVYVAGEETTPKLLDPNNKAASIVFAGIRPPAVQPPAVQPAGAQNSPANLAAPATSEGGTSPAAGAATAAPRVPQLTELRGKQLKGAMDALLAAYATDSALAQMVEFGLGENLSAIAGGSNLQDKVFSLLEWARMRGHLTELLQAAIDQSPNNAQLRQFIAGLS